MGIASSSKGVLVILMISIAAASAGAQQYRRAPRFEGKVVPEPPMQGKPWTAPETKLPKFLVTATRLLFEQGVFDPRGCDYREIEIGEASIMKTHAFLLPERGDAPGRFAICWDGLVRPAVKVGKLADLDADMKGLAERLKKFRATGGVRGDGTDKWSFRIEMDDDDGIGSIDDHGPIKLCMLLRIGRIDLAEALFAGGTSWEPGPGGRDLTDYHIDYTTLATDWARAAFCQMIGAHVRGEDSIALLLARRLSTFRTAVDAQADAMGFVRENRTNRAGEGPDRFSFLRQLDDLLRDQERRASTPRGPVPRKGGDPSARIAALIRDFDLIAGSQRMSWGSADPGQSAQVRELVAEGEAAVEPLLKALETDDRLTRNVSEGRGMRIDRTIHPVQEAEFDALSQILRTSEFASLRPVFLRKTSADPAARKAAAESIRKSWEKVRSVPLIERWYRTLRDDDADPERWNEAAALIALPESGRGWPSSRTAGLPPRGETLRVGRDPSVTDLLIRRARQMAKPTLREGGPLTQGFTGACQITSYLVAWDGKASLPLLKEMFDACRQRSDRFKAEDEERKIDGHLGWALAQFTRDRTQFGDPTALDDYAAWLQTATPKMVYYNPGGTLIPLYLFPEYPAIAAAARWMFTDPRSPWLPILPEARGIAIPSMNNFFASSLIVAAGFREGTIAALADRSPYGTISRTQGRMIELRMNGNVIHRSGVPAAGREGMTSGTTVTFRTCDYIVSQLSELQGCPQFELFWSEPRRDEAIAACVAYLKRYGHLLVNDVTQGWVSAPGHVTLRMKFPTHDRPATREDVAACRAIFSLEGEGETRTVKLPDYPQTARWVVLKDRPIEVSSGNANWVEYDADGFVWQTEEVRKGDRWERYYGFVGHHIIARVPAAEVEFTSRGGPFALTGGLVTEFKLGEAGEKPYEPGRPIPVGLRVVNRLGVPREAPIEFVRPGPDGKPALRKGMTLMLFYTAERGSGSFGIESHPDEEIALRRDVHFDPGPALRSLEPLESFEAARLDLADWFDVSRPGRYRLAVKFAQDTGVGEGYGSEAYFQVGGDD